MPLRIVKTCLLICIISVLKQVCDTVPSNPEKRHLDEYRNSFATLTADKPMKGENKKIAIGKKKVKAHFTKADIDKQSIDVDSELELLLESMSGNGKKAMGIHPNQKSFIKGLELEEKYILEDPSHSIKRNFIVDIDDKSWPNGTVPYILELDTYTDEADKEKLQQVMLDATAEFKEKTCIKLVPKTEDEIKTENLISYIKVRRHSSGGCSASVGRNKHGSTVVNLATRCFYISTVLHEFCHSLGMRHEQSRYDRDDHVTVHLENVRKDKQHNLAKRDTLVTNPYDYSSLMQYSLRAFSSKSWENTIEFRDPDLEFLASSSKELTFYDVMDITKVYKCDAECTNGLVCKNGGFLNHKCECYCPEGLTGESCDTIVSDSCGGIINLKPGEPVNITSPNYPLEYNSGTMCYWLLRAENANQRIMIQVLDFNLPINSLNRCYHWLEVRYNLNGQPGQKFCGNEFHKNKISTTEFGNPDLMMLIFDSDTVMDVEATKGFLIQAEAFELKPEGCTSKPPRIRRSSRDFEKVGSAIGAIVHYECREMHRMVGQNSVTCQADGTWSEKRGQCDKRDVVFKCNFERNKCGITLEKKSTHKWGIEGDTANKYFTVTPASTSNKKVVEFMIPYSLKSWSEYCLSFSFRRISGNGRCASLIVHDSQHIAWSYRACDQIEEWTLFKGTYKQYVDGPLTFRAEIQYEDGGEFNFEIDDIILSEGGGC